MHTNRKLLLYDFIFIIAKIFSSANAFFLFLIIIIIELDVNKGGNSDWINRYRKRFTKSVQRLRNKLSIQFRKIFLCLLESATNLVVLQWTLFSILVSSKKKLNKCFGCLYYHSQIGINTFIRLRLTIITTVYQTHFA